jgi:hypothetical protein
MERWQISSAYGKGEEKIALWELLLALENRGCMYYGI